MIVCTEKFPIGSILRKKLDEQWPGEQCELHYPKQPKKNLVGLNETDPDTQDGR